MTKTREEQLKQEMDRTGSEDNVVTTLISVSMRDFHLEVLDCSGLPGAAHRRGRQLTPEATIHLDGHPHLSV